MALPLLRLLPALALAALLAPGLARADDASIVSRDVPLRGERRWPRLRRSASRWSACTGRGAARSSSARARSRPLERVAAGGAGGGGPARSARAASGDAAPGGSATRGGSGPSDAIRYRLRGDVRRLRAWFVWSPEVRVPARSLSLAGSPAIVPRSAWRADESIVRAQAGAREQDPLLARAPHRRPERVLGGRVCGDRALDPALPREGQRLERHRLQLPRRPLRHRVRGSRQAARPQRRGAHAEGSTPARSAWPCWGSTGRRAWPPPPRARSRGCWPGASTSRTSTRSRRCPRSPGATRATPRGCRSSCAVSGHRDTGFTSCPGNRLYARLDAIAAAVGVTGLPKLYEPAVTGGLGGQVRFRARLSSAQAWR